MTRRLTVADLFREAPKQWGLRGDPHLWAEMRQYFEGVGRPASAKALALLIEEAFEELAGLPISHPEPFYVEKYSHGGMSSGYVHPGFWRGTAIPFLQGRLLTRNADRA